MTHQVTLEEAAERLPDLVQEAQGGWKSFCWTAFARWQN